MSAMSSPDCRDRNHAKCNGDAWDLDLDQPAHCPCPCHVDAAHGARIDYHQGAQAFHDYGVAVTDNIIRALSGSTPGRAERRKQERAERRKQERDASSG